MNRRLVLGLFAIGAGFALFYGAEHAAKAANEIVSPCVWEVTCDGAHPDGGVPLKPSSSQCPNPPHNSFTMKNVKEDGTNNAAAVYLGTAGLGSKAMNTTTKGFPVRAGDVQPIDSDPAWWFCEVADAGSETIELMGGSR